jgi:hypothetical protein
MIPPSSPRHPEIALATTGVYGVPSLSGPVGLSNVSPSPKRAL